MFLMGLFWFISVLFPSQFKFKSIDGVLGDRSRGRRMEVVDGATRQKNWRAASITMLLKIRNEIGSRVSFVLFAKLDLNLFSLI